MPDYVKKMWDFYLSYGTLIFCYLNTNRTALVYVVIGRMCCSECLFAEFECVCNGLDREALVLGLQLMLLFQLFVPYPKLLLSRFRF